MIMHNIVRIVYVVVSRAVAAGIGFYNNIMSVDRYTYVRSINIRDAHNTPVRSHGIDVIYYIINIVSTCAAV